MKMSDLVELRAAAADLVREFEENEAVWPARDRLRELIARTSVIETVETLVASVECGHQPDGELRPNGASRCRLCGEMMTIEQIKERLVNPCSDAARARDLAHKHLEEIARSCHTLSPQEFTNHAAIGRGMPMYDYVGSVHPHRSIYELVTAVNVTAAAIERIFAAHLVVVSNGGGGGTWKRHVEPEIYAAHQLLRRTGACTCAPDELSAPPTEPGGDL